MNKQNISIFIGGIIFGLGLAISGMTKPEIVLSFLQLKDFGLLILMFTGIIITTTFYHLIPKIIQKPLFAKKFSKYKSVFSKKTIIGAIIFGIGWGISGICPGAAFAGIGTGNWILLFGIITMFLGAYVEGAFFE